jgi:hypothetical protein
VILRPIKLEIQKKKVVKTVEEPGDKNCAMKLSQIGRRIELYRREIILRFEMNL